LPTNPPFPYAAPCQLKEARATQWPPSLTNKKGRNVGNNGADRFQFLTAPLSSCFPGSQSCLPGSLSCLKSSLNPLSAPTSNQHEP
jgi:hypothetical protein